MPLLTSPFVAPLEDDWRETVDALGGARGWPTSREPERLGALVANLSAAYNAKTKEANPSLRSTHALAARLGFSFPRDVPKTAGAIRELLATGTLTIPEGRALRILDLGSGLGASTWGAARALERVSPPGSRIEATCIDDDGEALALASAIARERSGRRPAHEVSIATQRASVAEGLARAKGAYDLVLFGQVLSEVGSESDPARVERHAELVRSSLDAIAPDGSVVLVEPALKDRTRHLHAVRDALLAGPGRTNVFAPCLHGAPCPALADEGAWCHEDLGVDLPGWLRPVAHAAGLRWQGLTFSYLVLRKDGRSLAEASARTIPGASLVRAVSGAIATKGKREIFVCGEVERGGTRSVARVRAMRLDRDAGEGNRAWDDLGRGDLVACAPPLDADKPRVRPSVRLSRVIP